MTHNDTPLLRLENVRAGYGKKEILHGLSLDVRLGEIVALIGANGAGKSTLLKAVMGLVSPSSGHVVFAGRDMARVPVHERAKLGMCYGMQNGPVFPSLSVRENMAVAALSLPDGERNQSVAEALALFPILTGRLKVRAGLLSGGQRQALALAMTFAQRPKVLLLDEPSAGLAPKIASEVLNTVQTWNEKSGGAVVMVEQRVKEALSIAHRVVTLQQGVTVETAQANVWAPTLLRYTTRAAQPNFFTAPKPQLTKA